MIHSLDRSTECWWTELSQSPANHSAGQSSCVIQQRAILHRSNCLHPSCTVSNWAYQILTRRPAAPCFRWNIGFIFDENLTFADQITSLPKACYSQSHVRKLCCIRPYLDLSTACTVATSIVHSKLNYSYSLYYKLPKSQLSRLQQIQNSLARTVIKAPKSCLSL